VAEESVADQRCAIRDIAARSALLVSNEGAVITGQVVSVNSGATMRP